MRQPLENVVDPLPITDKKVTIVSNHFWRIRALGFGQGCEKGLDGSFLPLVIHFSLDRIAAHERRKGIVRMGDAEDIYGWRRADNVRRRVGKCHLSAISVCRQQETASEDALGQALEL